MIPLRSFVSVLPLFVATAFVWLVLPAAVSGQTVQTVHDWTFTAGGDAAGWTGSLMTGLSARTSIDGSTGVLGADDVTGTDPRLNRTIAIDLPAGARRWETLRVRLRMLNDNPDAPTVAAVAPRLTEMLLGVTTTGGDKTAIVSSEMASVTPALAALHWLDITLDLRDLDGQITALRIDPIAVSSGNFEVAWIRLSASDQEPLSLAERVNPTLASNEAMAGVWAEARDEPPAITLHFLSPASYLIYRRGYGETDWGTTPYATTPGGSALWTDTAVEPGEIYEYALVSEKDYATIPRVGAISAGVRADRTGSRGTLILVVADNMLGPLSEKIDTLQRDLIGEGWRVRTLAAPAFHSNPWSIQTINSHGLYDYGWGPRLRNEIRAIHAADPEGVKMVYFLGHTPVVQSGLQVPHPDGHGSRGPYATDHYFADLTGRWTDTGVSYVPSSASEIGSERALPNLPGDGVFDQNDIVGSLALGVGRVDAFSNVRADNQAGFESDLAIQLGNYLDKAHRYKNALPFEIPVAGGGTAQLMPGRKAIQRDNPGGQLGASAEAYGLLSIFGPQNMEPRVLSADLPKTLIPPVTDDDSQQTVNTGPYLYYGQNSGGPSASDPGAQAVHRYAMQSWWGDWHVETGARRNIGSPDNMALTYLYTNRFYKDFISYPLAVGETFGEMMRRTADNRLGWRRYHKAPSGIYGETRFLRAMVGDPTLRLFVVPPPRDLVANPAGDGSVGLSWTAPDDESELVEYRVLRSGDLHGEFVEIARGLTVPTYVDQVPPAGPKTYLVRAVHLTKTGGGTLLHNSAGAFASVGLRIDTTVIPALPVGEAADVALASTPTAIWSVTDGQLPHGLSLASDGRLTGSPVTPGLYEIELSATTGGETVSRRYPLFVRSAMTEIVEVDLRATGGLGLAEKTHFNPRISTIGRPLSAGGEGMLFSGNEAVRLHDFNSRFSDAATVRNWPQFRFHSGGGSSVGEGWALVASFKAEPDSPGGIILCRGTNLSTNWQTNRTQYAVLLTSAGRLNGRSWTQAVQTPAGIDLRDGQWHQVVYTASGSTQSLYLDGVLVASGSAGRGSFPQDMLIGARWTDDAATDIAEGFHGVIADVKVYNTGISAGEVASLHARTFAPRDPAAVCPPVISGLPTELRRPADGSTLVLPFAASDPDGDPIRLHLVASDPKLVAFHEFVRTADSYELHLDLVAGVSTVETLTVAVDDTWAGHVVKHAITVRPRGAVDDVVDVNTPGVVRLNPLSNDIAPDGQSLVFSRIVQQPASGTLVFVDGRFHYYPSPVWGGPVTFTYEVVAQPSGEVSRATVELRPTGLPVAREDRFLVPPGDVIELDVLSNDTDASGGGLRIVLVTQPVSGVVRIVGGQLEYMPGVGPARTSTFTYTVENRAGFRAQATVTLTPVDDEPGSPLLHYRFDEASTSASALNSGTAGSAADGVVSGAISRAASFSGTALNFNGSTTVVTAGEAPSLMIDPATQSFSVSVTLTHPDATRRATRERAAYSLLSFASATGNVFDLSLISDTKSSASTVERRRIVVRLGTTIWRTQATQSLWTWTDPYDWSNHRRESYNWRILTVSHDVGRRELRVYLDNKLALLADTSAADLQMNTAGALWRVGARPATGGQLENFTAVPLDDVRVYDRALEPADILANLAEIGNEFPDLHPVFVGQTFQPPPNSRFAPGSTITVTPTVDAGGTRVEDILFRYRITESGEIREEVRRGPLTLTHVSGSIVQVAATAIQHDSLGNLLPVVQPAVTANYFFDWTSTLLGVTRRITTEPELPAARVGTPFSINLAATGAIGTTSWRVLGDLPPGLSLTSAGRLSGTPTQAGVYVFTLHLSDLASAISYPPLKQEFRLQVRPIFVDTNTNGLPDAWEASFGGNLDPAADPGGRGVSNQLAWLLGVDPLIADPARVLPVLSMVEGPSRDGDTRWLALRFQRRLDSDGFIAAPLHPFESVDLSSWTRIPDAELTLIETQGDTEIFDARVPLGQSPRLFLRLQGDTR